MKAKPLLLGAISGLLGGYFLFAATEWFRYGKKRGVSETHPDFDPLLNEFMPEFEVRNYQRIRVAAPAAQTLLIARRIGYGRSSSIQALFNLRNILLGRGDLNESDIPRSLTAVTQAQGWSILSEVPGKEIVMGAAAQPWVANTIFKSIPRGEFLKFNEPGYVKIVWTLKVQSIGEQEVVLSTETRALATDDIARKKFRLYWSFFSPGVRFIRREMMKVSRNAAEGAARSVRSLPQQSAGVSMSL